MIRAKIRLETGKEVANFVQEINSDGSLIKYTIEDETGEYRVNARSYLGVLYASAEFGGKLFLVNRSNTDLLPSFIDKYRPLDSSDGDYIHS